MATLQQWHNWLKVEQGPRAQFASFPDAILEHPVDFEWPFTRATTAAMRDELARLAGPAGGRVLCLGCPSLFYHDVERTDLLEVVVMDKNVDNRASGGDKRRLIRADLLQKGPEHLLCDIALIDPPWYNDYYMAFISAASICLRQQGHLLVSFPPEGTRPTAAADLQVAIAWAQRCGLALLERRPDAWAYRTPMFELNALRACGIRRIPLDWRRGDALVFAKTSHNGSPDLGATASEHQWREFRFGPVRLKVRDGSHTDGQGLLWPLHSGGVMPSVSARFPARDHANIVSSGNRFIFSARPDIVCSLLDAMSRQLDESCRIKRMHLTTGDREVQCCARQLRQLIRREQREAVQYFNLTHGL